MVTPRYIINLKDLIGKGYKLHNFDEPIYVIDAKRIRPINRKRKDSIIYLKFRYSNKFETIEVWHSYDNIKKGQVRNYLKLGKYDTYYGKPSGFIGSSSLHNIWMDMHYRCNEDIYKHRNYYGTVKVVEEWRVYQNFVKWVRSDKSNYDTRLIKTYFNGLNSQMK